MVKRRGVCAGRALRREDISPKSEARFWAKVKKGDDHWLWTACLSSGIPFFSLGGRSWTARRVVWALTYGEAPAGAPIGACVEPLCLNPEHLSVTTAKELAARRVRAGVGGWDAPFVGEMRSRYQSGESPARLLKDAVGVPYKRLHRMLRNRTYSDGSYVPPPGRASRGEEQHCAKFTWDTVREARRLFSEGTSVSALARKYGLAQSTTWDMAHGVTWKEPIGG